jgi:hypothetical protein
MKVINRLLAGSVIAAAALAASTAPAWADGGPVTATVAVPSTLTFAFTSATSFSVAPGATAPAAVAFTVTTNNPAGYAVSQSAPDLVAGANSLPAGELSFALHFTNHDGTGVNPPAALTNLAATFANEHTPSMNAGDTYAQDWSAAALSGATPGGNYATTITYVAAGN